MVEDLKKSYVLAIETSCDETAISALADGEHILSHKVHSQADLHAQYGGVFPNLAKREHAKNITPLLSTLFHELHGTPVLSSFITETIQSSGEITVGKETEEENNFSAYADSTHVDKETIDYIKKILARDSEVFLQLRIFLQNLSLEQFALMKSSVKAIAVTYGPGLEPALWVGISTAKALATLFGVPLYPINHMEGHIASVLTPQSAEAVKFPGVALLISGGHTELVQISAWHQYHILGKTVDDAVGEAYDKVARLIGLPYPGGPAISKLAEKYRFYQDTEASNTAEPIFTLPRPMIYSKDLNFSFSGLKTAVLYAVKNKLTELGITELTQNQKEALAGEFEKAVVEVLLHKTKRAIIETGAHTLIIGGGVIANTYIRTNMQNLCKELKVVLHIPEFELATDNASMIGLVACLQITSGLPGYMPQTAEFDRVVADGNLRLSY